MPQTKRVVHQRRSGVAAVEAAIVLPVSFLLLFGALDVAVAIQRQNLLAECACRAARLAIVRGELSSSPLGPAGWTGDASMDHPIAQAVRPMLVTLRPSSVTIRAIWDEGSNDVGQSIRLTLTTTAPTFFAALWGSTWNLSASSTMLIAH